jgi:hypothetical protein
VGCSGQSAQLLYEPTASPLHVPRCPVFLRSAHQDEPITLKFQELREVFIATAGQIESDTQPPGKAERSARTPGGDSGKKDEAIGMKCQKIPFGTFCEKSQIFSDKQRMMIAICVLLCVAKAMAGLSQPTPDLSVQLRDGRQAEIRFINNIKNPGANVNINGVIGNPFSTQGADVSVKLSANPTAVAAFSVPQDTFQTAYQEIDTGNAGSATVSVTFATTTPVTIPCPNAQKNDRTTYILAQQSFTAPSSTTSSGTCSVGMAPCTTVTGTVPGSISFSCQILYVDSLATKSRSCSNVPVRFFNQKDGCPVLFETAETGTTKTFLLRSVPTTFAVQEDFDRKVSLQINDVNLFAAPASARFVDATISPSGTLTTSSYSTGFLNIVNLAYRENPAGTQDNTFNIVVSQANTISGQLSKVVHFQQSLSPASFAGWIEVPVGSYFVHVFDNGDSETAIFGDNSLSSPTAPSAASLAVSAVAVAIAVNDVKIVRITNSNSNAPLLANSLEVNAVVLNNNPEGLNTPDTTRHVIWNNVLGRSLKLAKPDDDCCNYLEDFDDFETIFQNPGSSFDTNTIVPGTITGSFKVFDQSSVCTSLGSPLVSDEVTLADTTSSGQCADQGIFVFGRPVSVTSQVCTSTSMGSTTCSAGVSSTVTSTVIASTLGAPTDTNPTGSIDVSATVNFCDCAVVTPACTALTCEEERTLQQQVASVASLISASTSAVTAAVTASQNALGAVLADTNADVGNTNSTLLAAINTRTSSIPTIVSDISAVRSDIRRLRNEVGDVEDAVDDVEDAVDDVQDAVDDL